MNDSQIGIGSDKVRVTEYFDRPEHLHITEAHCGECFRLVLRRVVRGSKVESSWFDQNHQCRPLPHGFVTRKV